MNILSSIAGVITIDKIKAWAGISRTWVVGFITEKPQVVKGSVYVLIFLALVVVFLSYEAEAATGRTEMQIGATFVGNRNTRAPTLLIQETFANKYAVSIGYIGEQKLDTCGRPDCQWTVQEQIMVGVERVIYPDFNKWQWLNRLSPRIGPYWFQNANRVTSCRFNMRLALGIAITDSFGVVVSHFSNAGSCPAIDLDNGAGATTDGRFNMGQDAILLQWRF